MWCCCARNDVCRICVLHKQTATATRNQHLDTLSTTPPHLSLLVLTQRTFHSHNPRLLGGSQGVIVSQLMATVQAGFAHRPLLQAVSTSNTRLAHRKMYLSTLSAIQDSNPDDFAAFNRYAAQVAHKLCSLNATPEASSSSSSSSSRKAPPPRSWQGERSVPFKRDPGLAPLYTSAVRVQSRFEAFVASVAEKTEGVFLPAKLKRFFRVRPHALCTPHFAHKCAACCWWKE